MSTHGPFYQQDFDTSRLAFIVNHYFLAFPQTTSLGPFTCLFCVSCVEMFLHHSRLSRFGYLHACALLWTPSCARAHNYSTVLGVARTSTTHLMVVVLFVPGWRVPPIVFPCVEHDDSTVLGTSTTHHIVVVLSSQFTSGALLIPRVARTLIVFLCIEHASREWRILLRLTLR